MTGGRSLVSGGFDVIIAGGGWGGLGTGALLSKSGARVLLMEARPLLGGRASYQERNGFLVDFGIHAHRFGRTGVAAALYRELGATIELIQPESGLVEYRGKSYPVPLRAHSFVTSRILGRRNEITLLRALRGILLRPPQEGYKMSVRDLLPAGTDRDTREFIGVLSGLGLISQDLAQTSAGEFARFIRDAARSVNHLMAFPRNGCKQHVHRLGGFIRENGEVTTGLEARRVVVENGIATGVESGDGVVKAGAVVLALPSPQAAGMIPEGCLSTATASRMQSVLPSAGLSWDVGLKRPVSELHVAFCLEPLIIGAFPSNYDPLLCSPGLQLTTWCMPLPLQVFGDADALRRESAVLRRKVFHMFPALEENILWERMLTLRMIDGAVPLASQAWPSRPGPAVAGVKGLFLAGDTVGVPGQGGDIAFRSALECAPQVLEYLA